MIYMLRNVSNLQKDGNPWKTSSKTQTLASVDVYALEKQKKNTTALFSPQRSGNIPAFSRKLPAFSTPKKRSPAGEKRRKTVES